MTTVTAEVRRPLGYDSFDTLLPGVEVARIASDGVTFDADLTDEQVDAVRCYITARDDDDQAARADLAAKRDAAEAADLTTTQGLEALRALTVAAANYLLGQT